ncbi:MAG: recombination-associated protein RdgC [Rhodoferax sp.]|nr:recombination-associated protein RdgC [Rhodoferax sp.]
MFKNLMVYRLTSAWTVRAEQLEAALEAARFVECGSLQDKSVGWIAPRGEEGGPLVEVVGGQWILRLMVETKAVPGSVVKRKVEAQIEQIEATTGRKPGRKETRDLKDDARMSLLPLAFSRQSAVWVWVDPKANLLMLDAGSQARADEVVTALVKALDSLAMHLVQTEMSPAAAMSLWLSTGDAPVGFTVDQECELKAVDASRAVVRYTRHPLDGEEIPKHIQVGKVPTRLALSWAESVSFVLTDALAVKKIAFLDGAVDDTSSKGDRADDRFDADVAIATGELRKLLPALLDALGGETPVV